VNGRGYRALFCAGTLLLPGIGLADGDEASEFSHRLAGDWSYGGAVELESAIERRFDLDAGAADVATLEPSLELGLAYEPPSGPSFHAGLRLAHGAFLEDETRTRDSETQVEIRQAYLWFDGVGPGLSFGIGRQRFEDARQWWYDEDLDALTLSYETGRFSFELAATRNEDIGGDFLDRERAQSGRSFIAVGRYDYDAATEFAAYLIAQDRGTDPDEEPVFLGLRAIGGIGPGIEYWADVALVRGTDSGRDIRAHGFDVGGKWSLDLPLRPALLLGLAFGSGDRVPDDGVDGEFRQTGLQNSYFYYGEVLAPELSNLWIHTAGFALEPRGDTAVDVLYHRYRQDRPAATLRDVLIEANPDGVSRDIGQSLDVTVSVELVQDFWLDMVVGVFDPGAAFGPDARRATFAELQFTYEFW
jgi:alginate production protein